MENENWPKYIKDDGAWSLYKKDYSHIWSMGDDWVEVKKLGRLFQVTTSTGSMVEFSTWDDAKEWAIDWKNVREMVNVK